MLYFTCQVFEKELKEREYDRLKKNTLSPFSSNNLVSNPPVSEGLLDNSIEVIKQ
jgi:hypothetical protein